MNNEEISILRLRLEDIYKDIYKEDHRLIDYLLDMFELQRHADKIGLKLDEDYVCVCSDDLSFNCIFRYFTLNNIEKFLNSNNVKVCEDIVVDAYSLRRDGSLSGKVIGGKIIWEK